MPEERVDHAEEALELLETESERAVAAAQAYATLAVAEQLERLNQELAASNLTYADVMVRNA